MEQIEDLDSYSCTNPKRRMTFIFVREAHGNKLRLRKLQKKRRNSRSKKTAATVQNLFLFSS
jgi:hypothetical protein